MDKLQKNHQRYFFEAWFTRLLVREPEETKAFLISCKDMLWKKWLNEKPYGG